VEWEEEGGGRGAGGHELLYHCIHYTRQCEQFIPKNQVLLMSIQTCSLMKSLLDTWNSFRNEHTTNFKTNAALIM